MGEDHTAAPLFSDAVLSCRSKLSQGAHSVTFLLFLRSYQWLRFLVTFEKSQTIHIMLK